MFFTVYFFSRTIFYKDLLFFFDIKIKSYKKNGRRKYQNVVENHTKPQNFARHFVTERQESYRFLFGIYFTKND
jgi:hypothetical protein